VLQHEIKKIVCQLIYIVKFSMRNQSSKQPIRGKKKKKKKGKQSSKLPIRGKKKKKKRLSTLN
jgi:hypothetical protein